MADTNNIPELKEGQEKDPNQCDFRVFSKEHLDHDLALSSSVGAWQKCKTNKTSHRQCIAKELGS